MPESRRAGRGDESAGRRGWRRDRLLAPAIAVAAVWAGVAGEAGGAGASLAEREARPQPPASADVEVSLRDAVGRRATRRPPAPDSVPRGGPAAVRRGGTMSERVSAPGGRRLFPETRVVAVYGAPQLGATIVGRKSPSGAASEARRLAERFGEVAERASQPGIDLIATVATADRGPSGLYRTRQSKSLIAAYLEAARQVNGRLALDVQPGRARFIREVKALDRWLRQPDVDLALDPEWNVGRDGVPGISEGKVSANELNKVSRYLARLVRDRGLPQKALYVHQFRKGSIRGRSQVAQRGARVAVTLNFDGIGSPGAKVAGYRALSQPRLFNGFSIFLARDSEVMSPGRIARLTPTADYVMYQ